MCLNRRGTPFAAASRTIATSLAIGVPTIPRFCFFQLLGILGFQPFSYAYDAVSFVSSAERSNALTVPAQAAAAKAAASMPLCFMVRESCRA
jgi:hypothetical protein